MLVEDQKFNYSRRLFADILVSINSSARYVEALTNLKCLYLATFDSEEKFALQYSNPTVTRVAAKLASFLCC